MIGKYCDHYPGMEPASDCWKCKAESQDADFIAAVSRDTTKARLERIEASVAECLEILRGKK